MALPASYQKIGQVFPLTHFVIGYRNVALMGCGFSAVKKELLLLGGIIVVCLTLSCVIWQLRLNRIEKKKQGTVAEKEEPVSLQA